MPRPRAWCWARGAGDPDQPLPTTTRRGWRPAPSRRFYQDWRRRAAQAQGLIGAGQGAHRVPDAKGPAADARGPSKVRQGGVRARQRPQLRTWPQSMCTKSEREKRPTPPALQAAAALAIWLDAARRQPQVRGRRRCM